MIKLDEAIYVLLNEKLNQKHHNNHAKFYVFLAAIAALSVALHVILFFRHFAMSVRNEFICSDRVMFVMYLCLLLLLSVLKHF